MPEIQKYRKTETDTRAGDPSRTLGEHLFVAVGLVLQHVIQQTRNHEGLDGADGGKDDGGGEDFAKRVTVDGRQVVLVVKPNGRGERPRHLRNVLHRPRPVVKHGADDAVLKRRRHDNGNQRRRHGFGEPRQHHHDKHGQQGEDDHPGRQGDRRVKNLVCAYINSTR